MTYLDLTNLLRRMCRGKGSTCEMLDEFMTGAHDLIAYVHFHQPNALNGCKTPLLLTTQCKIYNEARFMESYSQHDNKGEQK
jgi:hypothetical protein